MKTTTHELSCSIFGHNLEPVYTTSEKSHHCRKFICTSCKTKVNMDANGEVQELPYKNEKISNALRQLFLLKRKSSERQFSI
ncbi:hypothetical protein ESY86_08275 [Subsaximicrobium wynnwilliamsii]|uniref:Uncharacterized protein n=1 Tax=Subsaximicrobium wynnwilliamsii TaxID=291179 RepID=A0A5C6ZHX8_9FLAO|nr:hypothetical protein [Subsaximicrobium wynnwilliamsii]TXD83740.1 hypothetical protein ESY87_08930 [Subsaximicrobium wynnwilliamsii]TXD89376.1 hypothetical protein ESY86_08275 [Subsaximicrobium wynnwilliamsii]TXE03577.1 hypothetical protein ESY88_07955 [Subsaximicrobium wynnwilliamsii]